MQNISGIFVDGTLIEPSSADRIPVINPYTRAAILECTAGNAEDVNRAVVSAQAAFEGPWSHTTLTERIDLLSRLADAVDRERAEIGADTTRQMGMPITDAVRLNAAVEMMRATIDAVGEVEFGYARADRWGKCTVSRRPVGVVGGIAPWNAPLRSMVKKIVPALLVGCTTVVKPAPETPLEALRLAELAIEVGFPPGVLNVVPGGAVAGAALASHPTVAAIGFTGSTASGAKVAAAAAPTFKRLQLELGGKSAAIILDDADLELAVTRIAAAIFRSSGQTCIALSRVFVPESMQAEFVDGVVQAAAKQVLGDPADPSTTMGPLATEQQFRRVESMLESVTREGGSFACGGRTRADLPGWFVDPTVIVDAHNDMTVAQEEIFGPALTVIGYREEQDAIRQANHSRYGLHGAVFSRDAHRASTVAAQIASGSVSLNGAPIPISAPFGGVKASGIGREHGPEGFDHVLDYHTTVLDN